MTIDPVVADLAALPLGRLVALLRETAAELRRLEAIGMTQFAGYLAHDNKEETLRVYGETVIPAFAEQIQATS